MGSFGGGKSCERRGLHVVHVSMRIHMSHWYVLAYMPVMCVSVTRTNTFNITIQRRTYEVQWELYRAVAVKSLRWVKKLADDPSVPFDLLLSVETKKEPILLWLTSSSASASNSNKCATSLSCQHILINSSGTWFECTLIIGKRCKPGGLFL